MRHAHRTRATVNIAMRRTLPPSRSRRIAKWTGLVVCVVILAIGVVSTRVQVIHFFRHGVIRWGCGEVAFMRLDAQNAPSDQSWHIKQTEFNVGTMLPRFTTLPRVRSRTTFGDVGGEIGIPEFLFVLPMWTLLTFTAIPTALLWHRDQRTVKPGCCRQCGYDLRASKKTCPECGAAFAPEPG